MPINAPAPPYVGQRVIYHFRDGDFSQDLPAVILATDALSGHQNLQVFGLNVMHAPYRVATQGTDAHHWEPLIESHALGVLMENPSALGVRIRRRARRSEGRFARRVREKNAAGVAYERGYMAALQHVAEDARAYIGLPRPWAWGVEEVVASYAPPDERPIERVALPALKNLLSDMYLGDEQRLTTAGYVTNGPDLYRGEGAQERTKRIIEFIGYTYPEAQDVE